MEGLRSRDGPLSSPGAAGSTNPATPRSASGVGACPVCGAISTGATTFLVPVLWSCSCIEELLVRRYGHIRPKCGGTPRTPANRRSAVELRFPHRARRYQLGGSMFPFTVCWSCTYMEGFLTRGWYPFLHGWGRTPRNPAHQPSANRVRASKWCEAMSTGGSPFPSPVRRTGGGKKRF